MVEMGDALPSSSTYLYLYTFTQFHDFFLPFGFPKGTAFPGIFSAALGVGIQVGPALLRAPLKSHPCATLFWGE